MEQQFEKFDARLVVIPEGAFVQIEDGIGDIIMGMIDARALRDFLDTIVNMSPLEMEQF